MFIMLCLSDIMRPFHISLWTRTAKGASLCPGSDGELFPYPLWGEKQLSPGQALAESVMPVSHYRGSPEDPLWIPLELEHKPGGS